jgi:hypothetical protein
MALTALVGVHSDLVFNGVLDARINAASISVALIYQAVNLLAITVVIWLGALLVAKSRAIRLIDVAGTLALARAPYLLIALFGFTQPLFSATVYLITFSLFSIIVVIWAVALMYNACAVSCHLKGTQGTVIFIVGIILAEALSLAINAFVMRKFAVCAVAASLSLSAPAQEPTTQEASSAEIRQTAITVVEAFQQEDFTKIVSFFDDTMKKSMSDKQLKITWAQLQLSVGKLQKADTTGITEMKYEDYKILLIPCTFGMSALKMQLAFNKKGEISGLVFKP